MCPNPGARISGADTEGSAALSRIPSMALLGMERWSNGTFWHVICSRILRAPSRGLR